MSEQAIVEVKPACPKPCSSCPWRLANQGSKPDPHKFYTKANLARLWTGLRNGARMSCHPTDPRMAEFEGYESLAERIITHECAGALVLVQREFYLFQRSTALKLYRKQSPRGLTRAGLVATMERAIFGGTPLDPIKLATPDLNDPEIGYPVLGTWETVK